MPLRPDRAGLRIGGFVPFSTIDFPGRLAAVVFCQGCPWRCRYCHNPHLLSMTGGSPDWPRIEEFLSKRRGLLEAVVFSGGEPTAQLALPDAMAAVKALGFEVGLHTGGAFPFRLQRALDYADWVGLDVKAPFADYEATTRRPASGRAAEESLRIVIASGVAHEIRTTLHPALLDELGQRRVEEQLRAAGAPPTRWQTFRANGCLDAELVSHDP